MRGEEPHHPFGLAEVATHIEQYDVWLELAQADLTRANLYLARLTGTQFTRNDLHPPLLL